jgi:ubiquinone/menaquinone biosynthesis C-methylase UbiE
MRRAATWLVLALLLGACARQPARIEAPTAVAAPELNARFLDPSLDVGRMVEIFEGESREIAARREAIAGALGLAPGMAVADVGSGTGLFLPLFDRAVRPSGTVYAIEISPGFLDHLRRRAERERLASVRVVEGTTRSLELLPASVDLAFVCDTYHHFDHPRDMLDSLHWVLRPGGRLVVVDFERVPGRSADWVLGHVRAGKAEFRAEIESARFEFLREISLEGMSENYVLEFRRR